MLHITTVSLDDARRFIRLGIAGSINGRAIVFAGGEPLYHDGKIVGGVGVSGGSGKQDHTVAESAVAAL